MLSSAVKMMGSVERAACRFREPVQFTGWAKGKQQQAAFLQKQETLTA